MFNIHKRRFMCNPTVKELIEYLQKLPQDATVSICGDSNVCLHVNEMVENNGSFSTAICLDAEDLDECYENQFGICCNLISCTYPTWIVMYNIGSETYSSYVVARTKEDATDIIVKRNNIALTDVFRILDAQYATILIDTETFNTLQSEDDLEVKEFLNRFCFATDPIISTTCIMSSLGGNELLV